MSSRMQAPDLTGFTHLSYLGGGGFADVYLYRQHLPEQNVAIKVLRGTADDEAALRAFTGEANSMAAVNDHANIVTVFGAGVSPDRRPYIVMQYCPNGHYGDRVKQGPLRLDRVLSVGIKIASAVETAHSARIIHRDIKPSNILVNKAGEPALADFGISGVLSGSPQESLGYSPPYAPPEIVTDQHPGDERSDVYSLAATLWAMLEGHSPFELPGGDNSLGALLRRVVEGKPAPMHRRDVPASLERLLRQSMSIDPSGRPQSARVFALMLQEIERELGYQTTPISLLEEQGTISRVPVPSDAPPTQVGRAQVVDPDAAGKMRSGASKVGNGAEVEDKVARTHIRNQAQGLAPRQEPPQGPETPGSEDRAGGPTRNRRGVLLAGVAAVAVVLAVVLVAVFRGGGEGSADGMDEEELVEGGTSPNSPAPTRVGAVERLTGVKSEGGVVFSWDHAGGPEVRFEVVVVGSTAPAVVTAERQARIPAPAACVRVTAFVPGRAQATAVEGCV